MVPSAAIHSPRAPWTRDARQRPLVQAWPAALAWALGWAAMLALDGQVDLANLAMVLVLSSAVASLWLAAGWSVLCSAVAVAAFNWAFVPPRHTFTVDLRQHLVLLGTLLMVNALISVMMLRLRRQAQRAQHLAEREAALRQWGETLRNAVDPAAHASALHDALGHAAGVPVAVIVLTHLDATPEEESQLLRVGEVDRDQRAGLALCVREGRPLGPGSGRYEEQPDWYLPLRGGGVTLGAAVLRGLGEHPPAADLRGHAQALCDQLGQALQRALTAREEQKTRAQAEAQGLRNALLAAISHDYRTPLATIMGAASSLQEQDQRLSVAARQQLARSIVEEATRLARLTDNTLQLARLDTLNVALRRDWESAEEIVGTVLRRVRQRDPQRRVRARLEPELPLLWCDALLMSQLCENLLDNALKYSPESAPVEILVRRAGEQVVLAVRDRGPGIAPAWQERVFDVFQRGSPDAALDTRLSQAERGGSGVGLAVCRAIARAHGGELRLRARGHGGCSFECVLPLREAPQPPEPTDGQERRP